MGILSTLNPGFVLIILGVIACVTPMRQVRQAMTIIAPLAGIFLLTMAPMGVDLLTITTMGIDQTLFRVDGLSKIFALAFLIAALLNAIYAMHTDDAIQDGMAMIYAGSAVAATLCGDLLTLFVFWELTAVSSVFLILQSGTRAAYFASMRYLGVQILSGVLLIMGATLAYQATGTMDLPRELGVGWTLQQPGAWLVFIAFGIKAAFPFMHNWLQDSYPKATVVGAVVLSAFTTKLAVYALARVFPGVDLLIWIGAIMTVFPVFFAVIENDLRKVLSYSLNNQVGFMVCAIGLAGAGSVYEQYALNGAAAHAFAHIIYKGLLFMSMGAVLYRTGSAKASDLGGLYKYMPWTTLFCIIGAASISAFPFFSGFAAKSMTMSAVAHDASPVIWLMLLFASAGVLEHSGIKIPYFAFFGHETRTRRVQGPVKEAPFNMVLAMGMAAFICIAIGIPAFIPGLGFEWLYSMLPFSDVAMAYGDEKLYTTEHFLTQMQLLVLAAFAFVLLKSFKLYPAEVPGTVLDADWIYRKPGYGLAKWSNTVWTKAGPVMTSSFLKVTDLAYRRIEAAFSPRGALSRGPVTGGMAIWTAALLGVVLLLSFITVR